VIEFQKRRGQEDECFKKILSLFTQDGAQSGRIQNVTESKVKILATIFRKIQKINEEAMEREIIFIINNKVNSRSQCLQIMSDHKHQDQL
jgi:hypothetical protein